MSEKLTNSEFVNLNKFLHDKSVTKVNFRGKVLDIRINTNGLRYLEVLGVKYIQQNPTKNSEYALLAREGKRITWGIKPGSWDLCIEDKVERLN